MTELDTLVKEIRAGAEAKVQKQVTVALAPILDLVRQTGLGDNRLADLFKQAGVGDTRALGMTVDSIIQLGRASLVALLTPAQFETDAQQFLTDVAAFKKGGKP